MASKVADYRSLSVENLTTELGNSEKELFNLKVRWSTRQLASRREITKVKKKIARIKTVMREASGVKV